MTRIDYDYVKELEEKVAELRSYERGYAKPHVWNFIAKTLREECPEDKDFREIVMRNIISDIALAFAKRFKDEPGFQPLIFLDNCSPDPELYPFSELWEDE